MISVTVDSQDPTKVILTSTVTLYLEKIALAALSDVIEAAIRKQAEEDIKTNETVQKKVSEAASALLLHLLGERSGS